MRLLFENDELDNLIYNKCEKIDTMPLGWYVNFRYI